MVQGHSFRFSFARAGRPDSVRRSEGAPMRILVMGGFRGNAYAADPPPTVEDIRDVGIDDFDRLMAELAPAVDLAFDDPARAPARLVFRSLEDFHPDQLAARDPTLRTLREIKDRLRNPATFEDAATELAALRGTEVKPTAPAQPSPAESQTPQGPESDAATMERLFGTKPAAVQQASKSSVIDEMIRRLVAPAIGTAGQADAAATAKAEPYLEAADAAAAGRLRDLLHHPDLQRLEAAWRSLYALVSQIEVEEPPEISLLCLDRARLEEAVGDDGGRPLLARLLFESAATAPDVGPWAFVVGDYLFGQAPGDLDLLARLGAVCRDLGTGFLAGADPSLLGCADLAAQPDPRDWSGLTGDAARLWTSLRASAAAQAIALALPRVLLRLPYGKETDPCEGFGFEEFAEGPGHDSFLWGNPAFLCARLLAVADSEAGGTGLYGEIGELPVYIDRSGPEPRMQPCAEVYLSETAGRAIAQAGLIPVYSYQRRDLVRLGPLQSLAQEAIV